MYLKLHLVALRLQSRDAVHPACQLCSHVSSFQSVIAQGRQQPQVHGTAQPAPSHAPKHLHNVDTRFHCSQEFLRLDVDCEMGSSELEWMFQDGKKNCTASRRIRWRGLLEDETLCVRAAGKGSVEAVSLLQMRCAYIAMHVSLQDAMLFYGLIAESTEQSCQQCGSTEQQSTATAQPQLQSQHRKSIARAHLHYSIDPTKRPNLTYTMAC